MFFDPGMSSPGLEGIDGGLLLPSAAFSKPSSKPSSTALEGLWSIRFSFAVGTYPLYGSNTQGPYFGPFSRLLPVSPYSTAGSGRPATSLDSLLTWSLRCWPSSDYTPPVPSLMQTYTTVVSQVHARYSLPSKIPCTVHRHPGGPIHCAKMSPRAHCYGTFPPPGHLGTWAPGPSFWRLQIETQGSQHSHLAYGLRV